jgi:hypothetical protein
VKEERGGVGGKECEPGGDGQSPGTGRTRWKPKGQVTKFVHLPPYIKGQKRMKYRGSLLFWLYMTLHTGWGRKGEAILLNDQSTR